MTHPAEKEFVLNYAMNRWQLNFKRNVGPTSDSIRKCSPKSVKEWEEYYFANVRTREQIAELGKRLFQHISEDLPSEKRFHPELLNSITIADCDAYMFEIVIKRTFDGYSRERGV